MLLISSSYFSSETSKSDFLQRCFALSRPLVIWLNFRFPLLPNKLLSKNCGRPFWNFNKRYNRCINHASGRKVFAMFWSVWNVNLINFFWVGSHSKTKHRMITFCEKSCHMILPEVYGSCQKQKVGSHTFRPTDVRRTSNGRPSDELFSAHYRI